MNNKTFRCFRKNRYDKLEKAKKWAAKKCEETGEDISVYKCEYCGGWHIGHTPASAARRFRKKRAQRERAKGDTTNQTEQAE